jgi:hypothetical protein
MRVAIYARVSTTNGQSPEMQLSDLREYASRRGWEYAMAFARGLEEIGGQQMSIWILLGIAAWHWLPRASPLRMLLIPVGLGLVALLVLFPAAEDRYCAWAYLIVGVCFLEATRSRTARAHSSDG